MAGKGNDIEKKQGAQTGNNPGVSAVADNSRQPQDSVNAPAQQQTPQTQVNTQSSQQAPAQTTPATPQTDPTKIVKKTKKIGDYTPLEYTPTPYDTDAAMERMGKSNWLKDLNQQVQDSDEEARKKAEKASKYAKASAWGNFFSALGQLAGGGKNTYVKPESKYLTDTLAKADKAREMYDAIKASNQKSLQAAKQAWLDADQKLHMESEKLREKSIEKYNDILQKAASGNTTETTEEWDDLAIGAAENDKKRADAAKDQAAAAMIRANAYADGSGGGGGSREKSEWFTPVYGSKTYKGDQKTAGKFADIMEKLVGFYDPDLAMGKLQVDEALNNATDFDRLVRKFLTKYGNNAEVKEFIEKLEEK